MTMRLPARLAAITFAALALSPGCGGSPTRPAGSDIRLSLSVLPQAGSPSDPIAIDLRAVNAGDTPVWHCDGCGCGNGTSLRILGPDGAPVALTPFSVGPACPDGFVPFEPGGVLTNSVRFTGVLYRIDSPVFPTPSYAAPPGVYTVVATFGFDATSRADNPITLTRMATFSWNP
jgi:hypothetical protein